MEWVSAGLRGNRLVGFSSKTTEADASFRARARCSTESTVALYPDPNTVDDGSLSNSPRRNLFTKPCATALSKSDWFNRPELSAVAKASRLELTQPKQYLRRTSLRNTKIVLRQLTAFQLLLLLLLRLLLCYYTPYQPCCPYHHNNQLAHEHCYPMHHEVEFLE
eukprot:m.44767 g.44767  ORF g.44767 m.44767 type:complete len:164 (+) comp10143_c0_seq3:1003-1494(+)